MKWLILIVLGIGLPSIGALIGALMLYFKYLELNKETQDFNLNGSQSRPNYFGKYFIFQHMFTTAPVFGLLVVMMLWTATTEIDVPDEAFTNVGIASTLVIGASGFFGNAARGPIAIKGLAAFVKEPKDFGRAILHGSIPNVVLIFGLLIAVMALMGSGVLVSEFTISLYQSQGLLNAAIIYSCTSAGILLSPVLFNRIEEPFLTTNFGKGIIMNSLGIMPPLIGLVYVLVRFSEIGII